MEITSNVALARNQETGTITKIDAPLDSHAIAALHVEALARPDTIGSGGVAAWYAYHKAHHASAQSREEFTIDIDGFLAYCSREGIPEEDARRDWNRFSRIWTA